MFCELFSRCSDERQRDSFLISGHEFSEVLDTDVLDHIGADYNEMVRVTLTDGEWVATLGDTPLDIYISDEDAEILSEQ